MFKISIQLDNQKVYYFNDFDIVKSQNQFRNKPQLFCAIEVKLAEFKLESHRRWCTIGGRIKPG